MNIFPTSPIWANITREPMWSEEVFWYDSGMRQGSTPWSRPLYRYSVIGQNYNEIKQSSLHAFWNTQMGRVTPFLLKDPYDYKVQGVVQPSSTNMGAGSGFYFENDRGWRIIPDSSGLLVSDGTSGALSNGIDFILSQDNGWCAIQVTVTSVWTASCEYFRKVAFDNQMAEQSPLWNNFNTNLVLRELIPDR